MVVNDLRLPPDSTTIAHVLRDAGYQTGYVGKWHLDGGIRKPGFVPPGWRRQGFDFWAANECNHSYFDSQYFRDTPDSIPIKRYETEVWTDLALEFLRDRSRTQPFFLSLSYGPPHNPYVAPERFLKQYDPQRITLPENFALDGRTPPKDVAAYYAMVSSIDEQVGRLVDQLKQDGEYENTIIFFTSDHGDMVGSHNKIQKRLPFDESVRIPGIMSWPGVIPAGQTSDMIFNQPDFMPTLLGLCGIDAPDSVQGYDLSSTILGRSEEEQECGYLQIFGKCDWQEVPDGWRGVRTKRYTYCRFREKPWMLFDRQTDPWELHNRIDDLSYTGVLEEMDTMVTREMERTGDSWENNWTEPFDDEFPLTKLPGFCSIDEYREWVKKNPEWKKST
jgi:arylsulfatase A-like enzyme